MLSATSKLWELVEVLPNKKWKCKFCRCEYDGGRTRIMAHFAGVGGYGIHGCKVVDTRVRSVALNALRGERVVELSNRRGNVVEGLHQPMTASNEDASRETSIAAMPYPSSGAGSSAFLPLPDANFSNQSLPDLTNAPCPLNAEEEEPDTEFPQGEMPRSTDPFLELVEVLPNNKRKGDFCGNEHVGDAKRIKAHFAGVGGCGFHGCEVFDERVRSEALEVLKGERAVELSNRQGNDEGSSNLAQGSHQPLTASNEDARSETSFAAMPYLSYGAGSSAFLPLPETNLLNQSLPALTNMRHQLDAGAGEPYTEVPHALRCGWSETMADGPGKVIPVKS
ncbi:hypothetical protein NL676_024285 [Syzygium grande]|nr:hypothetical protein NL676_024285 [Syzygium grande]